MEEQQNPPRILNAAELVEHSKIQKLPAFKLGAKRNFPSGTEEEEEQLKKSWEAREELLTRMRVSKIKDMMRAEWDADLNMAVTTQLKGKHIQHMGRGNEGKFYFTPEEAVFLLEIGSLELFHGGMPVSIEESFFLAFHKDLALEKYQVYCYLTRAGYIVVPYQKPSSPRVSGTTSSVNPQNKDFSTSSENINTSNVQPNLYALADSGGDETFDVGDESENSCEDISEDKNRISPLNLSMKHSVDPVPQVEQNELHENISNINETVDQNVASLLQNLNEQTTSTGGDGVCLNNENDIQSAVNCVEKVRTEVEYDPERETQKTSVGSDSSVEENIIEDVVLGETFTKAQETIVSTDSSVEESVIEEVVPSETFRRAEEDCDDGESNDMLISNENPALPEAVCESIQDESRVPVKSSEWEGSAENLVKDNVQEETSSKKLDQSCILVEDDESVEAISSENSSDSNDASEKSIDEWTLDLELTIDEDKEISLTPDKNLSTSNCDEEVVFLEVKKKETKPLAVIDLSSDDELDQKLGNVSDDDDDWDTKTKMKSDRQMFSVGFAVRNASTLNVLSRRNKKKVRRHSKALWPLPDFAGKTVVCLNCPPPELLPPNVTPSRIVYPIDIDIVSRRSYNERKRRNYSKEWNYSKGNHLHSSHSIQQTSCDMGPPSLMNLIENAKRSSLTSAPIQNISTELSYGGYDCYGGPRFLPLSSTWAQQQNNHPPEVPFVTMTNSIEYSSKSQQVSVYNAYDHFSKATTQMRRDSLSNTHIGSSSFIQRDYMVSFEHHNRHHTDRYDNHRNSYHGKRRLEDVEEVVRCPPASRDQHFRPRNSHSSTLYTRLSDNTIPVKMSYHNSDRDSQFSSKTMYYESEKKSQLGNRTSSYSSNAESSSKGYTQKDGPRPARPYSRHPPHWQSRQRKNYYRHKYREQNMKASYPCAIERVPSIVSSWSEYRSALRKISQVPVKENVHRHPVKIDEVLWSRDVQPLLGPTDVLPVADVLGLLNITHSVNLFKGGNNQANRVISKVTKFDVSFDVFLPGTNYKKRAPGVPSHRIVVTRSTDPFPDISDLVAIQKDFSDKAALQFAVVDGADISFYSFNDISLPTLYPLEDPI